MAFGAFGRILSLPPLPARDRALTRGHSPNGPKRVYSGCARRDAPSRRAPFFMLLLLDIAELGVMELARMFAPATPARLTVRVSSKVFDAGFLPLAPDTHILAARMAGAGTHRQSLSYWR